MPGPHEEILRRSYLDDSAQVHDNDSGAQVLDYRQGVGNEDQGQFELQSDMGQQIQNLRLYGGVEGRHRFVSDQQAGIQGKRPRDGNSLLLSPAQFGGVSRKKAVVKGHSGKRLEDSLSTGGTIVGAVNHEWFPNYFTHVHVRVKLTGRILKDQLKLAASHSEIGLGQPVQVAAVEEHGPGGRPLQGHRATCESGLAAAGLADHSERLAGGYSQIDAGQGVDGSAAAKQAGLIIYVQVAHLENLRHGGYQTMKEPAQASEIMCRADPG